MYAYKYTQTETHIHIQVSVIQLKYRAFSVNIIQEIQFSLSSSLPLCC